MGSREYPRICETGGKPHGDTIQREERNRAQDTHYGKPCVVCGKGTTRRVWVQVNWFRGDDEEIRLCCACWKTPVADLLTIYKSLQINP